MQKNKYGPSSLSYILLTMGSILIAIFSIYRIRELVLPSILNDEFGYWPMLLIFLVMTGPGWFLCPPTTLMDTASFFSRFFY